VFGELPDPGYINGYAARVHRTLDAVRRVAPPEARLLDIGAAQGNLSLALAELGYRVTWNDIRDELVPYVRMKHERGRIDFLPGNCLELSCEEPYDVVVVAEIIEHVAHPDALLEKVAALVRPGGHVIVTTPNGAYFRNSLPRFSDCRDPRQYEALQFRPDADGHIFLIYPDELLDLARQVGLIPTRLELFVNPLSRGALGLHRLLRVIPRRVVRALERLTSVRDGTPFSRLNLHMLAVLERPAEPVDSADPRAMATDDAQITARAPK
jgi:2-polyprenyl-6-hydroxyphenyl methylase/3-demethylubiquinone-9 3-methyltransferase